MIVSQIAEKSMYNKAAVKLMEMRDIFTGNGEDDDNINTETTSKLLLKL